MEDLDRGLSYEARDGAAWLTFERPEVLNAIDPPMKLALVDAVERFEADGDSRVLVVAGSDCGAFCVGSDLKVRAESFDAGSTAKYPPYADTIAACSKPVVGAIDGYCVGGGWNSLSLATFALRPKRVRSACPRCASARSGTTASRVRRA